MDNKEYGVKLNVDIGKFKTKIQEAMSLASKTKDKISSAFEEGLSISGDYDDFKKWLDEAIKTKEKLQEQLDKIDLSGKLPEKLRADLEKQAEDIKKQIKEIEAETEKFEHPFKSVEGIFTNLGISIGNLKHPFVEVEDEAEDTEKSFTSAGYAVGGLKGAIVGLGADITKSMDRGIKSIKRFTLSLLGIHSVWTALSRAVRSYMAYDNEANARIQANWVALGAMFAPIVEKIVKWLQKLVAYINVFYKVLTGKNLIQTALDKVKNKANGTSKAVKGLNKELANFDEITNLNFDKGEDNDFGIADALGELENIELDPKIVEIITEIGEYVRDNIIPNVKLVWDYIKNNIVPAIETAYNKLKEWGIPLESVLVLVGLIAGGITGGIVTALGLAIFKILEMYAVWDQEERQRLKTNGKYQEGLEIIKGRIETNNKLIESGNLSEDQKKKLQEENNKLSQEAEELYKRIVEENDKNGRFTKEQVKEMNKLKREIQEITNTKWDTTVNLTVKTDLQKPNWYKFFEGLNEVLNEHWFFKWTNNLLPGKPSKAKGFAKGNVAYGPTYAEFGEYAGARSNPEITAPQNIMKQTMVEALQEALPQGGSRGGDTVLYVNGKELARATYDDFKSEGSRLGSSNVAVRRV